MKLAVVAMAVAAAIISSPVALAYKMPLDSLPFTRSQQENRAGLPFSAFDDEEVAHVSTRTTETWVTEIDNELWENILQPMETPPNRANFFFSTDWIRGLLEGMQNEERKQELAQPRRIARSLLGNKEFAERMEQGTNIVKDRLNGNHDLWNDVADAVDSDNFKICWIADWLDKSETQKRSELARARLGVYQTQAEWISKVVNEAWGRNNKLYKEYQLYLKN